MNSAASEPDPLEQVAESFLARLRAGERPELSDYERRHPELAAEIRDLIPALVLMEAGRQCVEKPPDPARPAGEQIPRQLGEYRILREVGRGGMGVVYEAVQESLGRHVALKVLPYNRLARPDHLERFRREARAAARLHHSNIVPVFGVGESDGVHYYAMQFIHGQGLDEVLQEVRRMRRLASQPTGALTLAATAAWGMVSGRFDGPLNAADAGPDGPTPSPVAAGGNTSSDPGRASPPAGPPPSGLGLHPERRYFASVARVGVQAAEALEHAHRQGILHRDVKPSNLLLDTAGQVWVADFGLAKAEDSGVLTLSGDILGTFRYMAPERFQGRADARSDVYGLGVTLYELLTLRPAFETAHPGVPAEQLARLEPPRPRQLDPRISRDLETVVLKAMAREPGRRYQTAGELAEDLGRFLADRPIRARRTPWRERAWRWCRRNPAVAGLLACVAALSLVIAGGAGWVARDRAERRAALDREVGRALDEAREVLGEGKWPEAGEPLRRAEKLLAAAGRSGRPPLLRELQRDLAMARRLEEIYSRPDTDDRLAAREQDADYSRAFRDYQTDVVNLPPEEAAARIRARVIRADLIRALDCWYAIYRRYPGRKPPHWKKLLAVARAADRDPWCNRLRDAVGRGDHQALAALAASADVEHLAPGALHLLGRTLAGNRSDRGAQEQAVALLLRAHRRYPADLWINDALGECYLSGLRRYDDSVRFYTAALAVRPHSPYFFCCIGWGLVRKGACAEAVAEFSKAIELKPDYLSALCSRADAYLKLGQPEKALADYSKAIAYHPRSAYPRFLLGRAYTGLGQWDKAAAAFSKEIEVYPRDPSAWDQRGRAYAMLGQWEKAVADYSKAVELNPKYALAWNHRGWAYGNLGQWEKTVADCSRAVELDPKLPTAWNDRGWAYGHLRQWDRAVADCSRAIELDAGFAHARHDRGWAYMRRGQWDKALADYSRAVELDPGYTLAWNDLAWLLATHPNPRRRDPARAVHAAEKAVRLVPQDGNLWNTLGAARYRAGDWQGAVQALGRSVELRHGGDGFDWFFLALAHGRLGHREEARRWYEKAVRWTETNPPADEELSSLRAEAGKVLGRKAAP